MVEDRSLLSRVFDIFNYCFLVIFSLATFLPFVYVFIHSFSAKSGMLWPASFSLDAYRFIFSTNTFIRSLGVSVYITIFGTAISLILTSLMAYALSYKHLKGRSLVLIMIIFTMLFHGGIVPIYFTVKTLGMINTLWALMLPNAISAFYLIILKSFFQNIPDELKDSAKVDGAHELTLLFRIVIPLSLPAIAAFGLFYSVGIWNQYFNAVMFIQDNTKWPVQVLLRQIVILSSGGLGNDKDYSDELAMSAQGIKMAVIIISTLPIIIVYPFLQKHFAKGVLLGSVKG
ncbi:carbohydrate ABC transporter permease [Paenibacillus agricola]|uniref:Carbohydrate ABC transporter permease n=1 Tax=Paenibacillus agricola TaxID=2716264 RepID=A0ABX0J8I9_9BACL|nr:carbohydrate ABC transporter permease [Paenibacillus agricola]NHN32684.1 carbohydrate ABC transporter permease [Paenibacillus agricola]